MAALPIHVVEAETAEGKKQYVTCLSHEHIFERGLRTEAILGVLLRPLERGEAITPAVFARNRAFVDFMHSVIARCGPQVPGLIAEARRQIQGWVYIVDQRTRTPQGAVPPEDIIGVFTVNDSQVELDSYQSNPNHTLFSEDGIFQLHPELQTFLLEELMQFPSGEN